MTHAAWLRALEHVHGHLGVLAAAALWHPAVLLSNPRRKARLSAALSASLVTLAALPGAYLYPLYRSELKQRLFIHSPRVGWLFERKEHLAVGAIALAWAGLVAHLAASGNERGPLRDAWATTAHVSFVGSAALATAVVVLGVIVASTSTF